LKCGCLVAGLNVGVLLEVGLAVRWRGAEPRVAGGRPGERVGGSRRACIGGRGTRVPSRLSFLWLSGVAVGVGLEVRLTKGLCLR